MRLRIWAFALCFAAASIARGEGSQQYQSPFAGAGPNAGNFGPHFPQPAYGKQRPGATRCPSTVPEWRQWAQNQVEVLVSSGFEPNSVGAAHDVFERCGRGLKPKGRVSLCIGELKNFVRARALTAVANHSFGLEVTDQQYLNSMPDIAKNLPTDLKDPTFLRNLDQDGDPQFLERALQSIENVNASITDPAKKWTAFFYESQHLPTSCPSKVFGRLFVLVPGDTHDRYIQFGLRTDRSQLLPNQVSMVTVKKATATEPAFAWPMDLWRVRENNQIRMSDRLAVTGRMENCYECHKSAVHAIQPRPDNFNTSRFADRLKLVNDKMSSYGPVKMAWKANDAGPALGPIETPTRTDAFLQECSRGRVQDPQRRKVLAEAMKCATCHDDGKIRGRLNFPAGVREQPSPNGGDSISLFVWRHKTMPKTAAEALSDDERAALVDCLKQEYYGEIQGQPGLLKRWLLSNECWS